MKTTPLRLKTSLVVFKNNAVASTFIAEQSNNASNSEPFPPELPLSSVHSQSHAAMPLKKTFLQTAPSEGNVFQQNKHFSSRNS
ncbi:MAG: hypothetical protein IJV06_11240 [Bacteroidaceae bacterium]|nr:hypothetical protein [Bacteroidaceae bacterium]